MDNRANKSAGFTLVEMAIVVIIFGLGLVSFSHVVDIYLRNKALTHTNDAIAEVSDYIGAFRELYGRYPCPASLTDERDDASYGRENCTDMSGIAPGACSNGICIEESTRTFTYTDPVTGNPVTQKPRVRVGFVPFRQLNMQEDQAYDGYTHRIVYAVTEHLAYDDSFQPNEGGIDIVDDTGGSLLETAATAHFIVFSHGENGDGAYTVDGVQTACPATGNESMNCDLSSDAIFSFMQASSKTGNDNFDDVASFFTQKDLPLWQMSEEAGHEDDAHVKNPGKVGFGVDDERGVTEDLQVGTRLRAQDDPETTGAEEGKILTTSICDYDGHSADCFAASKIGGQIADGEGMSCPSGQYMKGIENSGPICADEIVVKCPSGYYLTGFDANGDPECNTPPPRGCASQEVTLTCPGSQTTFTRTLNAASNGARQTVRAGHNNSVTRTFECRDSQWVQVASQTGLCECIEDTDNATTTPSCATNSACGAQYSGTRLMQDQFLCPAATWRAVELENNCVCEETYRDTSENCSNYGFNSGKIYYRNTFSCATRRCSGAQETSRTCKCTPDRKEEPRSCGEGYSGTYRVFKEYKCPNGETSRGFWDANWTEVPGQTRADMCTCSAGALTDETRQCPEGYTGQIVIKRNRVCENGVPRIETTEVNQCTIVEPVRCKWDDTGTSTGSGRSVVGVMVDSRCECGVDTTSVCSKAAGSDTFKYYFCTCGS